MKVEVDKPGLLALVRSVYPNWSLMVMFTSSKYGYYAEQGGWFWNKSIEMLGEERLHDIYKKCVTSWE